jgi:motility quorum-sensing regulator/GCU-specific mRNA interferase toxin
MEKRRPTYDLRAFQAACSSDDGFELTRSARLGAHDLALGLEEVIAVIQTMRQIHFYKSMTSFGDHKIWQDVYHIPWGDLEIYVKFTAGRVLEFRLLSFKER